MYTGTMNLRARFYLALATSIIVISIHYIAYTLYLYWTFKQTDIFVHALGGLMSGLYVLVALRFIRYPETLFNVIVGTLVIGIGWEVLELGYRVADLTPYYWLNMVQDLVCDCIGGVLAFYIWKKLPEPKLQN